MSHTTYHINYELRWIERTEPLPGQPEFGRMVKVLQQGYRPVNGGPIQWVDVPSVQEDDHA